jgi:hypothetical protein
MTTRSRLEDLVHWVVLLEATGLRSAEPSWQKVALRLGVHERTLSRSAMRFAGAKLRDISLDSSCILGAEPVNSVVDKLFGPISTAV